MAMINPDGTYGDQGGALKKQPVPTYPQTYPSTTPPYNSGGSNQTPPSGFPQEYPGVSQGSLSTNPYPQNYPSASPGQMTSSYDPTAQLSAEYQSALGRAGRPDEINQYLPAVQQYGWDAVKNQIDTSPEAQAFRKSGAGQYPGTNVFGSDPSTASFEQLLNKLTSSFATPQVPQGYDQAVNQLNTYLGQLNGPVYTPQQMNLLQTQATDPLMQRRDAARQQAIEHLASRGISPTSGIAADLLNQVDRSFDQQNTQQQGQFASNAVGLQRQNQATAAQLAPLISQFQQAQTQTQDQRNQVAATLAAIVPQLAQQRLGAAQGTLANSPSIGNLLSLLGGFQQQGYNQGANYGQGIAQLLAALMGVQA